MLIPGLTPAPKKKGAAPSGPRGCDHCPLDKVRGVRKVMGKVKGRPVFVWAQSPGPNENDRRKELVGRAGQLFWREAKRAGLNPKQCDVQNVVRCFPADRRGGRLKMRDPSEQEVHCCSIHSERARAKSKAKVWLVLGRVAKDALFGKARKPPMFFEGDTQVFILDHPSYLLRGAPPERMEKFREQLRDAAATVNRKGSARFAFVDDLNIRTVRTAEEAVKAFAEIREMQAQVGGRISIDEEAAKIDGKWITLCVGFCPKPGEVWVFVLDHPENDASKKDRKAVRKVIKAILEMPCGKTMHHGSYDDDRFEEVFGTRAVNFDYDTQFACYVDRPMAKASYSLLSVVARDYPQFSGYKDLVLPEAVPHGMSVDAGRKTGQFYLDRLPIPKLVRYNACDCHVTRFIEEDTRQRVPERLVRVYTDAAFTFDRMQSFGPLLDFKQVGKVEQLYPIRRQNTLRKLQRLAKNPNFSPGSPKHVEKAVYATWGIEPVNDKKDTKKLTLELMLEREYHEGLQTLMDYREAKNRADRVAAFRRSAEAPDHDGRVTTFWWLTGTRTGRLSSGGNDRQDARNLGNIQNIPSEKHLKNTLVSSVDWRDFVDFALKKGTAAAIDRFADMEVFLARDYSQMELRILAQITGEKAMIKLFNSGADIHAGIGSEWSEWDFKTIQNDQKVRRIVKGMHFGIIYGLTAGSLRTKLLSQGIEEERETVEGYVDSYWKRFKRADEYRKEMPKLAKRNGYVENLFGFRAPIDTSHRDSGPRWDNQAVNAPIQGAAHQVLFCALAMLWRDRDRYKLIRPQMEVHDSLVTVSKLRDVPETIEITRQLVEEDVRDMTAREFGVDWKVPLKTDLEMGFRYGGMVEWAGGLEETMREVVRGCVRDDRALEKELAEAA